MVKATNLAAKNFRAGKLAIVEAFRVASDLNWCVGRGNYLGRRNLGLLRLFQRRTRSNGRIFADHGFCLSWRRCLPDWRLAFLITALGRFHENGGRVSCDGRRMFQMGERSSNGCCSRVLSAIGASLAQYASKLDGLPATRTAPVTDDVTKTTRAAGAEPTTPKDLTS